MNDLNAMVYDECDYCGSDDGRLLLFGPPASPEDGSRQRCLCQSCMSDLYDARMSGEVFE